jgi:hypothetical protein
LTIACRRDQSGNADGQQERFGPAEHAHREQHDNCRANDQLRHEQRQAELNRIGKQVVDDCGKRHYLEMQADF